MATNNLQQSSQELIERYSQNPAGFLGGNVLREIRSKKFQKAYVSPPLSTLLKLDEPQDFYAMYGLADAAYRYAQGRKLGDLAICHVKYTAVGNNVIEKNTGLAAMVSKRFSHAPNVEDTQEFADALGALERARVRFNPWRGYRFSTYACNVMARELMRRGKVEANYRRLQPVYLDPAYERPSSTLLSSDETELLLEKVRKALDAGILTDLESLIISKRFPLKETAAPKITFQQIGNSIGLSKERVRQIQNIALEKLRQEIEGHVTEPDKFRELAAILAEEDTSA